MTNEKLSLAVFYAFVLFAIYSLFARFLPFEPMYRITYAAPLFAVALMFCFWRYPPMQLPASTSKFQQVLRPIVILIVFTLFFGVILLKGVGKVFTTAFGDDATVQATVLSKSSGAYRRRRCDYSLTVHVMNFHRPSSFPHCTSKEEWAGFKPGDRILFRVKRSALGFYVVSMSGI